MKDQYVKRLKVIDELEEEKRFVLSPEERGKLGGRPMIEDKDKSNAGMKSNRKGAGQPSRRKELSVVEKVKMAEDLEVMQQEASSSRELFKKGRTRYGLDTRTLKRIMSKNGQFEERKGKLKLKKGKIVGSTLVRAKGGGRKVEFQKEIDQVKAMVLKERSNRVALAKGDLFPRVRSRRKLGQLKQSTTFPEGTNF